jgi:4-amino-4-deoxy-L-arabinose transferase-like glycosyltransferase
MNHQRLKIGLIAAAGLILAGLGHYFVATQRDVYPLDGYVFYVVAAGCALWLWRTISRAPDVIWSALRAALRAAVGVIGDALRLILSALRELLPQLSARGVAASVIGLNAIAALAALLVPGAAWPWTAGWLGSLLIAGGYGWLQLAPQIKRATPIRAAARPANVIVEAAEWGEARLKPLGLIAALALLIAGQWMIGAAAQGNNGATPLPFITALRLDLPGNANLMLGGWAVLIAGAVVMGATTRRLVLSDYVPLNIALLAASPARITRRWLIVTAGGIVLWLGAIKTIIDGATGSGGLLPWLIAIGALAACWRQIDRARGVRWDFKIDRREALALSAALIGMALVMTYRLGDVPNSVWGDEGSYWSLARNIARGQVTPDVFGLGVYAFPMGGSVYQAAWLNVFGLNLSAWRLASVMAVLAAALVLYFLVRATLGKRVAWASLATLTVMPYALTYARLGYTLSLSLLPVTLTLALLWGSVRRDSRLLAFLAGGATGLAFYTHPSAHLAGLLALAWLLWLWITRRLPRHSIVWLGAAWMLGALIVSTPAVTYGLTREPEAFVGKFAESAFNNLFYARDIIPAGQLADVSIAQVGRQDVLAGDAGLYAGLLMRGTLRTALSFHTPAMGRDPYLTGALAEPFGWLFLIGLAWCAARFKRPGYAIWPLWLLCGACVLSAMSTYPPRAGLMLPIVPALAVLSALGVVVSVDAIARGLGGVPGRVKLIGAIGMLIVFGVIGLRAYFVEMPNRYPPDLENAMFWHAQTLSRNATLMLITAADLPPDYRPWGMREFDLPVAFLRLRPDQLASDAWPKMACVNECAVFFKAGERGAIVPGLQQAFGNGSLVEYADSGGSVSFYRFVPQRP